MTSYNLINDENYYFHFHTKGNFHKLVLFIEAANKNTIFSDHLFVNDFKRSWNIQESNNEANKQH